MDEGFLPLESRPSLVQLPVRFAEVMPEPDARASTTAPTTAWPVGRIVFTRDVQGPQDGARRQQQGID